MDPSNENPCIDISNHPDNPRRFVINAPDFSSCTTSALEKPCRDPHFRKNPSSQVNLVQDDFRSVPKPKGKKSVRPAIYQRKKYQVRNLSGLSSKNDLRNGCVSSLPPSLGQVNEARMQNSTDKKLKKRGSSSKSCESAKQTIYDMSNEIIVINKEATAEATIALNVGFPSDQLIDEEKNYGVVSKVDGVEQINYVLIRNHIIRTWRDNALKWVTKEMFVDIVPKHFGPLVDSAYDFLVSQGYINFGVAPDIKDRILVEPRQQNVIVVGAGLAGLGAARQLRSFGFKVTVLEGKTRAGGRVYTKNWSCSNRNVAVDLGGSILTGVNGNPLQILVQQLSLKLHKVRSKCPLYGVDGTPMDPNLDERVERSFNELLSTLSEVRESMGEASEYVSLGSALRTHQEPLNEEETKYFNWHLANLEFCNAGLLEMLSLALWDQDDLYEMDGAHCFLHGGNGKLVEALAENLNIHYGKTVKAIQYGSDGVRVTVGGGQIYKGDMALCTVPLGVLKSRTISFTPELPQRKLDAIRRLGFGLLNKVVLLFPNAFWRRDLDSFGHLSEHPRQRGEFFLFYSYANVAGGPVLIALVAGEAAYRFENEDPTASVNKVLRLLKGIYEPQGIQVPNPIKTHCTRWGSDPFTRGSYSNVAVGASGDDYDILAENVGDGRLFFAGEATCKQYPASMHGALLSGFREAGYMSRCASNRASGLTLEEKPPENMAEARTSVLSDLFKKPNEEFGRFALLFGEKPVESMAILRMTRDRNVPGHEYPDDDLLFQQLQSESNQQQKFHIYRLISRQHATELKQVKDGDAAQVKYLIDNPEVKLLGRKGVLGRSADSVIESIMAKRRRAASARPKRKAPPDQLG